MRASAIHLVHPVAAEPTEPWGSVSPRPEEEIPPLADHPVPPATRAEARALRDGLARLITRERQAAADFLLALADFDRRRGWEALGHRSPFDFLKKELKCSSGAASHRSAAARLIPEFPAVEVALRAGDLCLSSLRHLARVLRPENEADYLPRFYGLSAREAEALAAELLPRAVQPRREVVTQLRAVEAVHACEQMRPGGVQGRDAGGLLPTRPAPHPPHALRSAGPGAVGSQDRPAKGQEASEQSALAMLAAPAHPVHARELPLASPARPQLVPVKEVEPLSANLRRLHLTVSTRLLEKLEAARAGQAHARPGASTEQVLEAALDLLLEQQAKRRCAVKRSRAEVKREGPAQTGSRGGEGAPQALPRPQLKGSNGAGGAEPPRSPAAPPEPRTSRHIPAAVRREVWARDGARCQFPLDCGGICGSKHRLELDHLVPVALGGPSTAANLRVTCDVHNRYAARLALGEVVGAIRRRPDR